MKINQNTISPRIMPPDLSRSICSSCNIIVTNQTRCYRSLMMRKQFHTQKQFAIICSIVIAISIISTFTVSAAHTKPTTSRLFHTSNSRENSSSKQQVPIKYIFRRSLIPTASKYLNSNSSSVEPIALELEQQQQQQQQNAWTGSASANACPPADKQQQSDNQSYYKSLGYTQPQVSNFVRPMFYTLRLKVDPTKRKFTAQLMITLEISAPANGNVGPTTSSMLQLMRGSSSSSSSGVGADDSTSTSTSGTEQQPLGHRYLTLHAGSNIHVKRAFYVYTTRGSIQIPASKIGRDLRNELLTIDFHPNVITAGQGLLLIVYSGLVNETESHGLFLHHSLKPNKRIQPLQHNISSPKGSSNSNKTTTIDDYGLATHMQPSFARRLFPSWDEPHLKARFSLIVVLPFRGYQTLSNMPIHRKSFSLSCSGEPMQEIEFHTTPIMSTYLLTLVIGRFDFVETITPNNCRVRVYVYSNNTSSNDQATLQKQHLAQDQSANSNMQQVNHRRQAANLALNVAVKTIDRLETLLGVKYPLSKFDMIALRDFNSGGMENWGAAIFHENYLLYDHLINNTSTGGEIQVNGGKSRPRWMVVPLVVAHEIAHQWFGNLITSQSWTYLWLNEGFAQLLMYDLADHLFPDYRYWDMFIEDSRQSAMNDDELLTSSHALEPEVYSTRPLDAENGSIAGAVDQLSLFDEITYNKGALVVRTVYYLLGREQFFAGLQHYLLKHSYDIVRSHDLWTALEEASGLADGQLESLMQCWLNQEGYPLISVQILDEPNYWRLRLSQSRFTLLPLDEAPLNKSVTSDPSSMESLNESSSGSSSGGRRDQQLEPVWSLPVAVSSQMNPIPQASELQLNAIRRPPTFSTAGGSRSTSGFLFLDRVATILMPKASTGSWLKLNFNSTGHYRVDYQLRLNADGSPVGTSQQQQVRISSSSNEFKPLAVVDMLGRMIPAIRNKSMCVIDRLNLADDLFAMVKAGKKPTAYYLRFIAQAYEEETEIIVLRSIVDSLKRIKAIVSNGSERLNFLYDKYVQKYLRKVALAVNRETEAALLLFESATNNNNNNSTSSKTIVTTPTMSATGSIGPLGPQQATANVDTNQQKQQQQTQRLKQNINQLKEIEALIEASKIQFNDTEFHQRAAILFNGNFQRPNLNPIQGPPNLSPSSSTVAASIFDSMDREMRASIYSGALLMSTSTFPVVGSVNSALPKVSEPYTNPTESQLNDGLPVGSTATATRNVTAVPLINNNTTATAAASSQLQDPIVGSHSWHSSIFAYQEADSYQEVASRNQSIVSGNSQRLQWHQKPAISTRSVDTADAANTQSAPMMKDVFQMLVKAYETSESSGERYAICSALGYVQDSWKQQKLLNNTLFDTYFRPQDSYHVLESMARTKQGRKLIWDQFIANVKIIERRRLMTAVLKSLSHGGLIEQEFEDMSSSSASSSFEGNKIETQLRHLYHTYSNEYGKVLSITLEVLLINSKWYSRDHVGLLQYLESL